MRRLLILLAIIPLVAAGCTRGPSAAELDAAKPKTLTYWRVVDDEDAFSDIIRAYRELHPNVSIEYRKFRLEEYERELLNAFAEDRGPDIFSIHNTWIKAYKPKLLPEPATLKVPFATVRGGLQKERVFSYRNVPGLTLRRLQTDFVDQVATDVVSDGQIYGLPLALDILALYSNKDLLNAAGIAEPPKTWSDVQEAVKKITKINASGAIIQSGIGLGTSGNVDRATDILSLIMMQNGTRITDEAGNATFHQTPPEFSGEPIPPGEEAVTFYTDFANPNKEVYTWNASQPASVEAFATGKTAMMLGYAYHLPIIRGRAPKLKFSMSAAPQAIGGSATNFANYWVESVSKKTKYPDLAWDFIQFSSGAEQVKSYLKVAKKPTARKALREEQLEDIDLGVFAEGILTAKSWYRGVDPAAADAAILELIDTFLAGRARPRDALNLAASKVNQTIR